MSSNGIPKHAGKSNPKSIQNGTIQGPKGDLKCIKFRLKSTLGSLMYPKVTPRCLPSGHQAPRIVKNRLKGFKKDTQHVPNRWKNTTMGPKLAPRSKTSEAQAIKSSGDQGEGPAAGAKPSEYWGTFCIWVLVLCIWVLLLSI